MQHGRALSERTQRRLSERPDVLPGHAVRRDDHGRRVVRGGRTEQCAGAGGERTGGLNEVLQARLELGHEQLRQVRRCAPPLLLARTPDTRPRSPLAHDRQRASPFPTTHDRAVPCPRGVAFGVCPSGQNCIAGTPCRAILAGGPTPPPTPFPTRRPTFPPVEEDDPSRRYCGSDWADVTDNCL